MEDSRFIKRLQRFDVFPKALDDVRERANMGGLVTLLGAALMLFLLISEFYDYTQIVTEDSIYVDTTREKTLWINFDLTVLYVPCDDVEVDILDNFGEVQKGRREIRTQLVDGQASGGWFFGGGPNSVDPKNGCRVFGRAEIQKAPGNLHIAAGKAVFRSREGWTLSLLPKSFNLVNHLIQLVPSIYEYWNGQSVEGYQYAVHTNYKYFSLQGVSFPLPGLFIKWDISPFVVKYRETGRSFAHFLTRVCAVTGGIFVVLGLLYNGTSKAMAAVKRKKAGSQKAF